LIHFYKRFHFKRNFETDERTMDPFRRRLTEDAELEARWPRVYHNSFWSNYYSQYWAPATSYYNSLTNPPHLETGPVLHYDWDPTLGHTVTRANIRQTAKYYGGLMALHTNPPLPAL